jgi:RNA polymerase sigma-70 factor, ECF subfamily
MVVGTALAGEWPCLKRPEDIGAHRLDPAVLPAHIDRLYRAAWGLCGSRDEAEDLVQETFVKVLRKPRIVHSDDLGYLLRVLRNTFLSARRTAARRPRTTALPDTLELVEDRSAAPPDVRYESRHVYALIAALPESFRDALVAVDVVGLSYREAATALGVCEATLTSRLYRARHRVACELAPVASA